MPFRFFCCLLCFFIFSCTPTDGFDDAAFPADQQATEFAFRRMSQHGALEPVMEEGQLIDGWQFQVVSRKIAPDGSFTIILADRSGIEYLVAPEIKAGLRDQLLPQSIGFARGRAKTIRRELAAGRMQVSLLLSDWTPRRPS